MAPVEAATTMSEGGAMGAILKIDRGATAASWRQRTLTVAAIARRTHHTEPSVRSWAASGLLGPVLVVDDGYRVPVSGLVGVLQRAYPRPTPNFTSEPRTAEDSLHPRDGYDEDIGGEGIAAASIVEEFIMTTDRSAYLTLGEAAEEAAVSKRTIRRWICAGRMPRTLRCQQRLLIHPLDIEGMYQPVDPDAFARVAS